MCLNGFNQSIKNVENRLGADIVIVSKNYNAPVKQMLFLGELSTVELKKRSY